MSFKRMLSEWRAEVGSLWSEYATNPIRKYVLFVLLAALGAASVLGVVSAAAMFV